MIDNQTEVDYVLSKFFQKTDEGYINNRAEREILAYKGKQKQASEAGKASAKARKNKDKSTGVKQPYNENSTDAQPNIKQEPLTNNHKPLTKEKLVNPTALENLANLYLEEGHKLRFIKAMNSTLSNAFDFETITDALNRISIENDNQPLLADRAIAYCNGAINNQREIRQ